MEGLLRISMASGLGVQLCGITTVYVVLSSSEAYLPLDLVVVGLIPRWVITKTFQFWKVLGMIQLGIKPFSPTKNCQNWYWLH